MGDSYRCQAGSPASASDLLAHLKSSLGASSSKSAKTYAALAAGKLPGAQAKLDAQGRDQQRAAPSAFFSPRDSPSPDLLAKVASLIKSQGSGTFVSLERARATPTPTSGHSTPDVLFGGLVGQRSMPGSAAAPPFLRPAPVTPLESGAAARQGLGIKRSATTPERFSGFGAQQPPGTNHYSAASSRRQTSDGGQPRQDPSAAQPDAAAPPAWSEELLNWMLAEKAELLLEVQRLQRRQQEVQQELDRVRARAGSEVEDELQRLKVERRMLLEKLQRLTQQDADSTAMLERIQMENDALTTELERSQEVCKEMLAARRAARDALAEMSAQNARLVSAYVEKKQEAAQLKEELRQQHRDAETRIRALEANLHAAEVQCMELRSQLQQIGHLPDSPDLANLSPGPRPSHASRLPEPSPAAYRAGSAFGGEDMSDTEFASPFSSPARQRTPPVPHQQQMSSQQQQQGKENASWSGNRGSASAARRKPAPVQDGEQGDGAPQLGNPAGAPRQGKGEWDRERSELLSLLERLQRQLSAHAEQQAATPAKQPTARGQQHQQAPQPQPGAAAAAEAASPCHHAAAAAAPQPNPQPLGMHLSPERAASPCASPSPLTRAEDSPPAMSPPSRCSTGSTGPTPRHSHFSVPRHSSSLPPSRAEERASPASSRQSGQTAAHHSRRVSGVNLSNLFEGACSRGGSRASTQSDASEGCTVGGLFGDAAREAHPASAGSAQPSSPSSDSGAGTPPTIPDSPLAQPTPIIPPMATPFAVHPPEEAGTSMSPQHLPKQQQEAGDGSIVAAGSASPDAAGSENTAPGEQRLTDVERRNAALEAEVQRLRQLQQEADERLKQDELRRQIDQHKQAGNAAFQQQRYEQAVQEYTAGLELSSSASPSATAVLLCNRAAALHAMGRYLEAVADCFRAEQKDASYARLYHRRADAYCAIGAYDAASQDLARLVQLGCGREVQARLQEVQHKLKLQYPVNHYAVLGVKSSANPGEVKAAYRSLALKFHPDKAGQTLPHAAADSIFKLVTAANGTLSDAEKRRAHDLQCLRQKYRRFYSYHF